MEDVAFDGDGKPRLRASLDGGLVDQLLQAGCNAGRGKVLAGRVSLRRGRMLEWY